jgi:hypothetical protein
MCDVAQVARGEIVNAQDRMALAEKSVRKMRPEKAGSAGNQNTHESHSLRIAQQRPDSKSTRA